MSPEEKDKLESIVMKRLGRHDMGSKGWSTAYHGSLYLSAISGAAAALVLKLDALKDVGYRTDLAALLAAVAAILTTLAALGGFDRKWRANRSSRKKLQQLVVDLTNPSANLNEIRRRLNEIIESHEETVSGPPQSGVNPGPDQTLQPTGAASAGSPGTNVTQRGAGG